MSVRISHVPYDPEWPGHFARLQQQIRGALREAALQVEHVGSTAVPDLCAKPVIDVALVVANSADEGAYVPSLERIGYWLKVREAEWFEHRMLKSPGIDGNIHVFSRGCDEVARLLAFRDRLRTNEADRKLYERTKQDLATREWGSVQDYADAKSDVVRAILSRAFDANPGRPIAAS
jgi:GrpB-like predicted nucleotidyltransferase (UPF0157 family)